MSKVHDTVYPKRNVRYWILRCLRFLYTPLLEDLDRNVTNVNLYALAYSKAVEDTYLELEDDIKRSLIFKRDEDYSVGIRQYCCNQILSSNFNNDNYLLMEFGVYKGESINFFAILMLFVPFMIPANSI